jgi:hypothetical protein
MNKFIAVSSFLRKRLARTSFDNVEEFRQLLLLERLVLRPLRAWPAEAMFIGLGEQFPAETRILTREFEFWGRPLRGDNQGERAASIRMRVRRGWADGGRA